MEAKRKNFAHIMTVACLIALRPDYRKAALRTMPEIRRSSVFQWFRGFGDTIKNYCPSIGTKQEQSTFSAPLWQVDCYHLGQSGKKSSVVDRLFRYMKI